MNGFPDSGNKDSISTSDLSEHLSTELVQSVASQAADEVRTASGIDHFETALILGSGWKPAAETLSQDYQEFPMSDFTGFLPPTAQGHGGTIRVLQINDKNVILFLGRTHPYEGHPLWRTVHSVRTASALGVETIILTNAAGGLLDGMSIGQPVLISDHINFTARTPLVGADFIDLTDAYSPALRKQVKQLRPDITEAIYTMMPGPQYETPAEIAMLKSFGTGLVGMSTVYETITARQVGMDVLGISLVTNLAAGISDQPLNHKEVLEAGRDAAANMGILLKELLEKL